MASELPLWECPRSFVVLCFTRIEAISGQRIAPVGVALLTSCIVSHATHSYINIFCVAGLHPDEGPSALKYHACAQNVSHASHGFIFCVAGMHPDEGPSPLKYRTCAQNVSHATHSFIFCVAGLRPDEGPSAVKYRTCAQNVS